MLDAAVLCHEGQTTQLVADRPQSNSRNQTRRVERVSNTQKKNTDKNKAIRRRDHPSSSSNSSSSRVRDNISKTGAIKKKLEPKKSVDWTTSHIVVWLVMETMSDSMSGPVLKTVFISFLLLQSFKLGFFFFKEKEKKENQKRTGPPVHLKVKTTKSLFSLSHLSPLKIERRRKRVS